MLCPVTDWKKPKQDLIITFAFSTCPVFIVTPLFHRPLGLICGKKYYNKPNLAPKNKKQGPLRVISWICWMWNRFCSAALRVRAPLCFQLVTAAAGHLLTLTPLLKEYTHTHTHTHSPVIAYFLTSFNASVAPGVTRHGLLSYIWPGWVTPLYQVLSNHRAVLFPPAQD